MSDINVDNKQTIDLSNWIPKVLDLISEFRPGQIPTAEQLSDYFNLLIEQ